MKEESRYFIVIGHHSWGGGEYVQDALNNWLKESNVDGQYEAVTITLCIVTHPDKELSQDNVHVNNMGGLCYPYDGNHTKSEHKLSQRLLEKYDEAYFKMVEAQEDMGSALYDIAY
ncbi:MAG: hypothetical protein GY752_06205, partial [bacterium]|nr:hypothetical protein [bacterium]